ncbi:hypothetical protein NLJ89_g5685 [Agrocybe chaxingu]|uniref:F-box domain-containing protein n=1 Tax=Agrocybe chaxingu TaxID=84603 RepID=A0A9W8JY13_9AGAR|nr:hypothetical protein NLJ89_g5685 [Agrocybe chaxingu]
MCVGREISVGNWYEILRNCTNLISAGFVLKPAHSVFFPALKALRLVGHKIRNSFGTLAGFLRATPALTELQFDTSIFMFFSFDIFPQSVCVPHVLLRNMERLVFKNTKSEDSHRAIVAHFLKTGWTKLSPPAGRVGHLEFTFKPYEVPRGGIVQEKHVAAIKQSALVRDVEEFRMKEDLVQGYEVHLRHLVAGEHWKPSLAYSALLQDLPKWDEVNLTTKKVFLSSPSTRAIVQISKLGDDILWSTFMLNADMDQDIPRIEFDALSQWEPRALTIARDTSHVCRSWRAIILSSPSIWGKLIDVDYLCRLNPRWSEEIMRRTADAPLTVKGYSFHHSDDTPTVFLAGVLSSRWDRVEKIELIVWELSPFVERCWSMLCKPSPSLKTFVCRANSGNKQPYGVNDVGRKILGGFTPRLTSFSFTGPIEIDSSAFLLSRLRSLHIMMTSQTGTNPLSIWLQSLKTMHCLEHLAVYSAFKVPKNDNCGLFAVHLPHLVSLHVNHTLFEAASFIARLKVPPTCLDITASKFRVAQFSGSGIIFQLRIDCGDEAELPVMFPYVEFFREDDFSHITLLQLAAGHFFELRLDEGSRRFLCLLTSVEILETDMHSIDTLVQIPRGDQPILFPRLYVLRLLDFRVLVPSHGEDELEAVDNGTNVGIMFLQQRKAEDCPVTVLDLTECERFPQDLTPFRTFDGLEIIEK